MNQPSPSNRNDSKGFEAAYVLTLNEGANLARSLSALTDHSIPTVVLDSGSTDRTLEIAASFPNVTIESYAYSDHCTTYNDLTTRHKPGERVLILDADMVVSGKLIQEVQEIACSGEPLAITVPVAMYWEGHPIPRSTLCPPKPIAFTGGYAYFEPTGHGESISSGIPVLLTTEPLIHDDRKSFEQYLSRQLRYGMQLLQRSRSDQLTWRDRLRLRTPLFIFLMPVWSFLVRRGFRDGPAGIIYSLDRMIAEAIFYRVSVSQRLSEQ